ncbi:uncharacterized protein [Haliotis asinina]|uniref:uncharacterized protein isoform X2 n=1 Tax=Haliotis asinina TaxID=109174 RepID=UPI003532621B
MQLLICWLSVLFICIDCVLSNTACGKCCTLYKREESWDKVKLFCKVGDPQMAKIQITTTGFTACVLTLEVCPIANGVHTWIGKLDRSAHRIVLLSNVTNTGMSHENQTCYLYIKEHGFNSTECAERREAVCKESIGLHERTRYDQNGWFRIRKCSVTVGGQSQGMSSAAPKSSSVTPDQTSSGVALAQTSTGVTLAQTSSGVTPDQTSSGVTLAQTSSGVTPDQTSSGVTLAQTSSGVTPDQTSSGVTLAQTSSGVTPDQTSSGVTLAQTSSGVTLAQTSSGPDVQIVENICPRCGGDNSGICVRVPSDGPTAEEVNKLIQSLLLDRKTLSNYKRSMTSAEDNRPSAQAIGQTGVVLVVLGFVVVVLFDAGRLIDWLDMRRSRRMSFSSP